MLYFKLKIMCELSLEVEDFSNAKWRAFYKTDVGLEVRLKYREKAETKSKLIDELLKLNVSRNKLDFGK